MKHSHEVREPWRGHLRQCSATVSGLTEHIHRLKSQIHDAELETKRIRDQANDILVLLATEADMPKGVTYNLSQDATTITCETPDPDPSKPEIP